VWLCFARQNTAAHRRDYTDEMDGARTRVSDSPWFWAYLFTTFGLIALAIISPKYSARQTQIEREYQGRQRATQSARGATPSVELSEEGQTLITLQPLFFGLTTITTIAWIIFWRTHRSPSSPTSDL
jgi:hypothetical protein